MKRLCLFVLLLWAVTAANAQEAYFEFTDSSEKSFVIKLVDRALIAEARAILGGEIGPRSVMGIIVKRPAGYNPPWSYHLNPETITFFEFAAEVCDATMVYVEEHLGQVGGPLLPGNRWCPWTSRLVREIR